MCVRIICIICNIKIILLKTVTLNLLLFYFLFLSEKRYCNNSPGYTFEITTGKSGRYRSIFTKSGRTREKEKEKKKIKIVGTYFHEESPYSRTLDWACCVLEHLSPPLGSCTPWMASNSRRCRTCRYEALWFPSLRSTDRFRRSWNQQMRYAMTFAIQIFAVVIFSHARHHLVARTLIIRVGKIFTKTALSRMQNNPSDVII